jgi:hypothetical protein
MGSVTKLKSELEATLDDVRARIESGQIEYALVAYQEWDEEVELVIGYASLTETYSPDATWMLFKAMQEI